MKKQKLLAILFAVILALSSFAMAGCGGAESSLGTNSSITSSETDTEEPTEAPKELSLPISSDEALKMNYEDIYYKFHDAGFQDVDYDGLGDLSSSSDKQNNETESVTVDGKNSFNKNDKFMSNVKIRISYHSVKEADLPIDKYDLDDDDEPINYEDLITQFETAGFTSISTRTVEGNANNEGNVKEFSVNGKNCKNELMFSAPIDAKIVITYYSKKSSGSGNSTTSKNNNESKTESKTESKKESKSESKSDGAKPGETVTGKKMKITFEKAKLYDSIVQSEFYTDEPENGKKFLVLFFEVENISESDQYISGFSFDGYEDNYTIDETFILSNPEGYEALSATIAPGKKTKGYIVYEVKNGWKKFELKYNSIIDSSPFNFVVTSDSFN